MVPATGRVAFKKMSLSGGERPAWPGTRLSWLLCCSALLSPAAGYVIVSSVSWAVTNEVDEDLDSASTEEALPALLEDSSSIWQQSFPASAHKEDTHLRPRGSARARPAPAARGMFSYRRESGSSEASPGPRVHAGTARSLAHASSWGCLATMSTHEKVSQRSGRGGRCASPFQDAGRLRFHRFIDRKSPVNNGTRVCMGRSIMSSACEWGGRRHWETVWWLVTESLY